MKKQSKTVPVVPVEVIQSKIFVINGKKVLLDKDLAILYGVKTYRLNEQVKRNIKRFPDDFMFQLNDSEVRNLISQFAISSWGGTRKKPYAFTEQGVAMLSSVLNSERAIEVNIQIMRVFTQLRELISSHKDLALKIQELESKFEGKYKKQDKKILSIFKAIKELLTIKEEEQKNKGPMGFYVSSMKQSDQSRRKT